MLQAGEYLHVKVPQRSNCNVLSPTHPRHSHNPGKHWLNCLNTPENTRTREPTEVIGPKNAMLRSGGNTTENERHRTLL